MNVLLGVSGGIAAYKAVYLVRRLVEAGHGVQVLMTKAAQEFVTPRTFAVLSGRSVHDDLWGGTHDPGVDHVEMARQADVLIVAPATANTIAKLAAGLADDMLSTMALAWQGPTLIVPTMNWAMYGHPATRENLVKLRERGAEVIEPDEGFLAEGEVGVGRFPDPERIVARARNLVGRTGDLAGETILLTSGPTREPIDAVRYLSNPSSGRMGQALAAEALARGARVILISGPVSLPPPEGAEVIPVSTAAEMAEATLEHVSVATIAILVAAVADLRPTTSSATKTAKADLPDQLTLESTTDILATLGARAERPFLVGFAAQTEDAIEKGRAKMIRKGCDMMIVNDVATPGVGFGAIDNAVTILSGQDAITVDRAPKSIVAAAILDRIVSVRSAS